MIMRGGGAAGAAGLADAALCTCICTTLGDGACAAGGAAPAGAEVGSGTRGGTAIAGGAVLANGAGIVAAGGDKGTFGGITTTAGGRYVAATEAGVTILGAGDAIAGVGGSATERAGFALAVATSAGASFLASTAGVAAGGLTAGCGAGCSTAAPFCWVMARSTSPGREICERSILVLISSSPWVTRAEDFGELGDASERPRRCFRTSSASKSSKELECVFFSVTPTVVSTSRISLLLTSNSRARSLIRILLIRRHFLFFPLLVWGWGFASSRRANLASLSLHI
jgi:hypothetical protein